MANLDGRVLGAFPLASPADAHSHLWEMHPAADEVLFMLSGELQLHWSAGDQDGSVRLQAQRGLVVPRGVWHRLVLHEPGLLLALTAPDGTQLRPLEGGQP